MSDEAFEAALRAMLRKPVSDAVPASLALRAAAIPREVPAPRTRHRLPALAGIAQLLTAAAAAAMLVAAALLIRTTLPSAVPGGGGSMVVSSPFGTFRAADFALTVGNETFVGASPTRTSVGVTVPGVPASSPGAATSSGVLPGDAGAVFRDFGAFEIHWIEHDAPMTLVAYVEADAHSWWVSEIVASEGRPDGTGWLYFEGPFFARPLGSSFDGPVVLRSSRSTDGIVATLRIGQLQLSAFRSGAVPSDPTKGTPAVSPGTALDIAAAPDFLAVTAPDGGIAGYAPKALVLGSGPTNGYVGGPPDVPVYAPDLRTLVGYVVTGRGFLPLAEMPLARTSATPAGSASASLNPGELRLSTAPTGSSSGGRISLSGTLGGEVRGERACLWITSSGASSSRVALVWPAGYHAYAIDTPAGQQVQLNAPDYRVIASTGSTVTLSGSGPQAASPGADEDPCGIGSVFVVAGVVSVSFTSPEASGTAW